MLDDWLLSLFYAAWLAASTMPLGFMLGSSCSPCCGCGVADGKPRTDPKDEGTWVPSGTWATSVTWTFTANPGDESGETWFFYGSASTSRVGGFATGEEQRDWGNLCNWYSNKTTSPSTTSGLPGAFDKRATRLPSETAVVHIYTNVNTVGTRAVKSAYFWSNADLWLGSELLATSLAHDSFGGCVFSDSSQNDATINGGATFTESSRNVSTGIVNDGATFYDTSQNIGTVNGGATFYDSSENDFVTGGFSGTVNGGAVFNDTAANIASTVNGGATFYDSSYNSSPDGIVNGGAEFFDSSYNTIGTINDGATFNNSSQNNGVVNDGATFNDNSLNVGTTGTYGVVNGGATFNDSSKNDIGFAASGTVNGGAVFNDNSVNRATQFGSEATVNGGATFNDAACSERTTGLPVNCPGGANRRRFVAHPTDLPTCNGTAPIGCTAGSTCGCG
jgi:hypothetical protein